MNEEEKERQEAIADLALKIKFHENETERLKFVAKSYGWVEVKEKPVVKSTDFHPGKGWGPVIHKPTTKRLYYHAYVDDGLSSQVVSVECSHSPYCDDYEQHKRK
jgi:hypothetical protein